MIRRKQRGRFRDRRSMSSASRALEETRFPRCCNGLGKFTRCFAVLCPTNRLRESFVSESSRCAPCEFGKHSMSRSSCVSKRSRGGAVRAQCLINPLCVDCARRSAFVVAPLELGKRATRGSRVLEKRSKKPLPHVEALLLWRRVCRFYLGSMNRNS